MHSGVLRMKGKESFDVAFAVVFHILLLLLNLYPVV